MSVQVIGDHKVTNGSIESPEIDAMLAGEQVDILYSDPPWGDGNLKYWATMNKKMTGQEVAPISYDALLARIRGLVETYVRGHVFIETGLRWEDSIVEEMSGYLSGVRAYHLEYKSGSRTLTNVLVHGTNAECAPFTIDPTGGSGYANVKRVVENVAVPGGIILDPCCGMGYTAQAAVDTGMRFRGNELNAKRLAKTIKRLS